MDSNFKFIIKNQQLLKKPKNFKLKHSFKLEIKIKFKLLSNYLFIEN